MSYLLKVQFSPVRPVLHTHPYAGLQCWFMLQVQVLVHLGPYFLGKHVSVQFLPYMPIGHSKIVKNIWV